MEFERLHNINNGVRCFDTATSSTTLYIWTESGSTYFSVRGCNILQYAIKILPDDTVEINGLDDFVTIDTAQTITGEKTFSANTIFNSTVKMPNITGLIPYPYYTGNIMSVASDGTLKTINANSLPYVTLDTTQTITASKEFTSDVSIRGSGKYLAVGDGAKIAIGTSSIPSPINLLNTKLLIWNQNDSTVGSWEATSLPYVTLSTDQFVAGNKTFTGTSTTISGAFYLPNVTETYSALYCLAMEYGSNRIYRYQISDFVKSTQSTTFTGQNIFSSYNYFNSYLYCSGNLQWGTNSSNIGILYADGDLKCPYAVTYPTSSPPNAYLTGSGSLKQSTAGSSTRKIKKDIEDLDPSRSSLLHSLRPIWYRYSIPLDTPDEWGWFGFIAEEMAEILPQLTIFDYPKEAYVTDKDGKPQLIEGAEREPAGIRYDRLTVLLTSEVQRQEKRIEALEKQVSSLLEIVLQLKEKEA